MIFRKKKDKKEKKPLQKWRPPSEIKTLGVKKTPARAITKNQERERERKKRKLASQREKESKKKGSKCRGTL